MNKRTRNLLFTLLVSLAILMTSCNQEVEEPAIAMPLELPENSEELVLLAKFDLSLRTGVDVEAILTKGIEETVFDDSSLGVPEPGGVYEAVATPGYIIFLEANGDKYEYHASGAKVVMAPGLE